MSHHQKQTPLPLHDHTVNTNKNQPAEPDGTTNHSSTTSFLTFLTSGIETTLTSWGPGGFVTETIPSFTASSKFFGSSINSKNSRGSLWNRYRTWPDKEANIASASITILSEVLKSTALDKSPETPGGRKEAIPA